mmetsp:Transcript_48714/g.128763  ORF Transcript_48714/g.128763 Transcript_48714/m.128763 type:complete len:213 (-) Transcript_48714:564-1202(-)
MSLGMFSFAVFILMKSMSFSGLNFAYRMESSVYIPTWERSLLRPASRTCMSSSKLPSASYWAMSSSRWSGWTMMCMAAVSAHRNCFAATQAMFTSLQVFGLLALRAASIAWVNSPSCTWHDASLALLEMDWKRILDALNAASPYRRSPMAWTLAVFVPERNSSISPSLSALAKEYTSSLSISWSFFFWRAICRKRTSSSKFSSRSAAVMTSE